MLADRQPLTRIGLSVALPLLALAVQWLCWFWIAPFVWFLFFPSIFFSARLCGFWGCLLSTVLSAGLVWYFFIDPQLSWQVSNPANLSSVGLFLIMGYLFSETHERHRCSKQDAETLLAETNIASNEINQLNQKLLALDELQSRIFANTSHKLLKQAETKLKHSKSILNETQRLAGIGNWEWDLLSNTHSWSKQIYAIYGRPLGLPPADYQEVSHYYTPESWEKLSAAVAQAMATGLSYQCDAELIKPDGKPTWITVRGETTRDASGNIINLHGTVQDITAQKLTEAALYESQERLQLFIEYAPAALAMFDLDMCYIAASRRWRDDYGLGDRQLNGVSHYQIFPEIPEKWRQAHSQAMTGAVCQSTEDCFAREDGSMQWLRWEVRPWKTADLRVGGIVIFTENITAYKQAEAEIRELNNGLERLVTERTAELTAANQELDAFAYAVSHDLRAPLRAMSGFAQALNEDFGNILSGDAKTYLQQIDLASQKMNNLINGLLTLSRSIRGELERTAIDISQLSTHLLTQLAKTYPQRQVQVTVADHLFAYGDARMLESVLANLLDNAWKYTEHTPQASIRVYAEQRAKQSWICVADNGSGFDMAHANKLFQPFQRLHRQDEFPGIGIGLATVQRIIHRHGGTIQATGQPGLGAIFSFTLPDNPVPIAPINER